MIKRSLNAHYKINHLSPALFVQPEAIAHRFLCLEQPVCLALLKVSTPFHVSAWRLVLSPIWLAQSFEVGRVLHVLLGPLCHAPALSLLTPAQWQRYQTPAPIPALICLCSRLLFLACSTTCTEEEMLYFSNWLQPGNNPCPESQKAWVPNSLWSGFSAS